ncbi:MAG: bifunctional folylpolyglutamate synthase/dihydrofolate synthase, partial [Clostridiales bacterium]|nr:bifunctional folylpolyglutamate synthase/dihydrofolate synthase [Clostridiales bacterium]
VLGNSTGEIAAEKAGIIKKNSIAIIAPQAPEAAEVLHDCAGRVGAKCFDVTDGGLKHAEDCHPGLLGFHQVENAAAAELAIRKIWENAKEKNSIFSGIEEEKLNRCTAEGIRDARWPGRMEILSDNPFFMVDGAHNPDGASALADSLMKLYPGEKFVFAMGVLSDKDYAAMLEPILPLSEKFYTVTPDSARALGGGKLAELINARGVEAQHLAGIKDLLDTLEAGKKTVAFGSLYYIGDIEKMWWRDGL